MLPAQQLREAVAAGWIDAGEFRILPDAIQPASIDLRLGDFAWALRCSFLPDVGRRWRQARRIAFQRIDLRDGATLERDRPYLIPLVEDWSCRRISARRRTRRAPRAGSTCSPA